MGVPQKGKERRLWNPDAETAISFIQKALFAQIEKLIGELREARKSSRSRGEEKQEALPVRFLSHSLRHPRLIRSSGLKKDLGFRHAQVRESSNTLCMVIPPN